MTIKLPTTEFHGPRPGDEPRRMKGLDLLDALLGGLQSAAQSQQQQQAMRQQQDIEKSFFESQGMSPEVARYLSSTSDATVKKPFVESYFKERFAEKKPAQDEEMIKLLTAKDLINKQKEAIESGYIGAKFAPIAGGRSPIKGYGAKGAEMRAQYKQRGKALIALASGMRITNKEEFKVLADELYDPNLSIADMRGIVNALEDKINTEIQYRSSGAQGMPQMSQMQQAPTQTFQTSNGEIYDIPRDQVAGFMRWAASQGINLQ